MIIRIVILLGITLPLCGQIDTTAFSVNLDEFVVTAQYEPTHYKNAIHKVDIIKQEQFKQRGAINLAQALESSPALNISYDPLLGTSVKMRGLSTSNVAILVDGVPVIGRLNGAIDLSQINLQEVSRIEIIEGAVSNIYGNNAGGGAINIITKKNQSETIKVNVESQIESIGQQNVQSTIGLKKNRFTGNIHSRYFNYSQFPIDSLRLVQRTSESEVLQSRYPFNPKEQWGLGGFIRYDFDAEHFLLVKYDFNHEDVRDYGMVRRPQFNPYANDQVFKTLRSDLSLHYNKKWEKLFLDLTAARNTFDRMLTDQRFYLEDQTIDKDLTSVDSTYFTNLFSRAVFSYRLDRFTIGAGIINTFETGNGDRIENIENENNSEVSFNELASFVEIKFKGSDKLSLSGSGRYTHHSNYAGKFTPAIHFIYKPHDQWTLRGSYAQGYRSPSLKELYINFVDINHNIIGNPNLRPETSHDAQLTLGYEVNSKLNIGLNIFYTHVFDQINLFQYELLKFRYDNVDNQSSYGVQPSLRFKRKNFSLSTQAMFGIFESSLEGYKSEKFQSFNLNNQITYHWSKPNIHLALNHRHVGTQPQFLVSNEILEVSSLSAYEMVDFSVNRFFWKEKVNISLGIRNLLNIQQLSVSGSGGGMHSGSGSSLLSPGRSLFMNVSLSI